MRAHPYADKFPMLPKDELEELAESIRENGLRQPIVVDREGRILDGRNRAAACELVGITPETVEYDGDDLAAYVLDCNISRRHMSTGARAMAAALVLEADGRRSNGRWKYGALSDSWNSTNSNTWGVALRMAGTVLDWAPELAEQVIAGQLRLDIAYDEAKKKRDDVDAEKRRKAIEANKKREETIREREENDRMLTALTEAHSRYLERIQTGDMSIRAAYAAHMADTEKERRRQREVEMSRRDACRTISEAVRSLRGGRQYAETYLREWYPHEQQFLTEREWVTRANVESAVEFLVAIKEGLIR